MERELADRQYVESVSDRVVWTKHSVEAWEETTAPGARTLKAEAPTYSELASVLRQQEIRLVKR